MTIISENAQAELTKLRKRGLVDGVAFEPRLYFDKYTFDPGQVQSFASREAYRNRGEYPVRITHLTAIMDLPAVPEAVEGDLTQGDERLLHRYGMRVLSNDTPYMADIAVPIPTWHNKPVAGAAALARASVSWPFGCPWVMASDDTFQVQVEQIVARGSVGRMISCAWQGTGRLSGRPYSIMTSTPQPTLTTSKTSLNADVTRNEGAEPIDLTQMAVTVGPFMDQAEGGDAREVLINFKKSGNGTHEEILKGPKLSSGPGIPRVPVPLLGTGVGRAMVHALPQDIFDGARGWVLYPGQGIDIELTNFDTERPVSESIWVAAVGYAIIR
jgi:hypothetical protein